MVKRILDISLFHNRIEAAVKVRKNSNRLIRCCHLRKIIIVLQELKNFERWTAKVKYGSRLVAETDCIFFYQKDIWRYVSARKFPNMVKGMMLKASLYNIYRNERANNFLHFWHFWVGTSYAKQQFSFISD
jgi:hypothetical protein